MSHPDPAQEYFNPEDHPDYRSQDEATQEEFENAMAKDEKLNQDDIDTLTHDKRQEEADQRDNDIANGWTPTE